MPRKTQKPPKAARPAMASDLVRRASKRHKPTANQAELNTTLGRQRRPQSRPPRFPGRLGGR
jgi:hypothetical protein